MSGVCAREGCGKPLPPVVTRPRKWCSDKCRRQAWFDRRYGPCVDCGARLAHNGHCPERCQACETRVKRMAHRAKAEDVVLMWAEGMTIRQIATEVGWTPATAAAWISTLRAEGYDLPHRNSGSAAACKRRWAERRAA